MTAEIIIFNKKGAVISADSAVTIGKKTYLNEKKIFELCERPPIVIMIYGNSNFMNIPIEVLIADYKQKRNLKEVGNIEEIKEDFINYLEEKTKSTTRETIVEEINIAMENIYKIIQEYPTVHDFINLYENQDILTFLRDNHLDDVFEEIDINGIIISRDILKRYFSCYLKTIGTRLVMVGYNKNDLYISINSFNLVINYEGKIEYEDNYGITNAGFHGIIPFAQKKTIEMFLYGIDEEMEWGFMNEINYFINLYKYILTEKFEDKLNNHEKTELENFLDKILKENLISENKKTIQEMKIESKDHLLNTIEHLPIKEMEYIAEYLINITSLKQKISSELSTVGGEINVVTITKEDGIKWKNKNSKKN